MKQEIQEQVRIIDQDLIWIVPKGDTLNTEFGKIILGKKSINTGSRREISIQSIESIK